MSNLIRLSTDKTYYLIPDCIWDGVTDNLRKQSAIVIENGIIKSVCSSEQLKVNLIDPHTTQIIRMPGITIIPGLVDCHVHFSMNGKNLFKAIDDWANHPEATLSVAKDAACTYLKYGIVSVRDGSDKAGIGLVTRQNILNGQIAGPLVTATGMAIYKKSMYGSFLGPGVETVGEAVSQVRHLAATGVNQIKIVLSGLVSFKQFGNVGPVQFSVEELLPIVETCHSLGLKVMAHASSSAAVKTAVLAGIDSVEHGYFITSDLLELMQKHRTAWVPTLSPLGNLVAEHVIPYEGADLEVIEKTFLQHLSKIREAVEIGVLLGTGTDAGANHVFHGRSYYNELEYYSQAGLDNLTILKSATSASAIINGVDNVLGSIVPGKKPFFCCVSGNPLKDLSVLKKPQTIILPDPIV